MGLRGPAGPIHPFLDGPPQLLPHWPHSSPSGLCCSFHKRYQPPGLCTGRSLCPEHSPPGNLLGLSPSAPHKDLLVQCLTYDCTCPSPAPHPPTPRLYLAHCTCHRGTYYILCLLCSTCLPITVCSATGGPWGGSFTVSPAAAPGCTASMPASPTLSDGLLPAG